MNENEWRQLVKNALNNDEAAFDRLYKETERSVYFLCLKLLGNEQDAKDAAQETYLAAFNGLSTLDDGANFPKWINGIAVNQCKRFFRTPKNDSLDEKLEHGMDFSDEENFIPDDYVTDAEKRRVIMNMIDTELSEVQRQTVILYYYNGLKTNEIASIMDCPEGTVKYRLSAARDKIKEAVLIYEKENKDRLHAIVPIPILTLILRSEAEHTVVPDIRLFKNPAASAKHLKAGGKATMKNALTGKVVAAAAAVVVVGGGITAAIALNRNNDSNIIDNDSYISGQDSDSNNVVSMATDTNNSATDSNDNDSSAANIENSEPEDEGKFFDWRGINYFVPPDFKDVYVSGSSVWEKKLESGSKVYYALKNEQVSYATKHGIDSYQLEDVPEILREDILSDMNQFFDVGAAASEITVETEEQIEVLETVFIKRTGIVHAVKSGKATGDLPYAAYYGLLNMSEYDKVPVCWIIFSDDESTKSELESIADTLAEKIERIEE